MPEPETPSEPAAWPRHGARAGAELMLFRARHDDLEHPRSGTRFERLVLETPEWCNVVATTPEGRLVLVRQYRFGLGRCTTEIPGGMVDPGERPLAAARRELAEETGYSSEAWSSLGAVEPNPAFQDNLCHTFLAQDAGRTSEPSPDPGEDLEVLELSEAEVRAAIEAGEVRHSLVIAALARVLDLRALTYAPIHPADPGRRASRG